MTKGRIVGMGLLGLLALGPLMLTSPYWQYVINRSLIHAVLVIGLVFLLGIAGQTSLGHAAFYGIGAYTSALITMELGLPIPVGMIAATVVSFAIGTLLAIPSFNMKGPFLAIVTIGFLQIVLLFIINMEGITGGVYGLRDIPTFALPDGGPIGDRGWYLLILSVLAGGGWVVNRIHRSFMGRALMAIRDDELAAEVMAVNSRGFKLFAFAVSAGFAGLAGSLFAHLAGFLSPEAFAYSESANFVAMTIVGGYKELAGGIAGALTLTMLPEGFRFLKEVYLAFSSLLILVIIVRWPAGLVSLARSIRKQVMRP